MNTSSSITGIGASPFDSIVSLMMPFILMFVGVLFVYIIRYALVDIVKDGIRKGIEEYEESRKED